MPYSPEKTFVLVVRPSAPDDASSEEAINFFQTLSHHLSQENTELITDSRISSDELEFIKRRQAGFICLFGSQEEVLTKIKETLGDAGYSLSDLPFQYLPEFLKDASRVAEPTLIGLVEAKTLLSVPFKDDGADMFSGDSSSSPTVPSSGAFKDDDMMK